VIYTYADDSKLAASIFKNFTNPDGTKRDIVLQKNTYDLAGHLQRAESGSGTRVVTMTPDEAGRVATSTADPNGRNRVSSFQYWPDGLLKHVEVSENGRTDTLDQTYTKLDRVATSTVGNTLTTRYGYDQRGLRTSMTSPKGNITN